MEMSDLNRREFVIAAACAAGACMMCGTLTETALAADAAPEAGGTKIDIGVSADYPKDGPYDKLAESKKIIVVRESGKIYAMSAVCTHKMGTVRIKGTELVCPKHNSHFATDGKPKSGPAKAALFRLGISENADGHLLVDPNKKFGENQWADAGASVSVKA
jgi:nitrite reductase/ring-hydroxylating ferredoxin subunit